MLDYKLFLDDIREPSSSGWLVARSYDVAVEMIKTLGIPKTISLDHDLGLGGKTGYDLVKFIIEYDQLHNDINDTFDFHVHSANPVGAENMKIHMNNYIKFKNEQSQRSS
jgi:hypothetical protein